MHSTPSLQAASSDMSVFGFLPEGQSTQYLAKDPVTSFVETCGLGADIATDR